MHSSPKRFRPAVDPEPDQTPTEQLNHNAPEVEIEPSSAETIPMTNSLLSSSEPPPVCPSNSNQMSLGLEETRDHWREIFGEEFDIIIAETPVDSGDTSFGLSLEGTVDVENGAELRPHHYVQSIQPDSLAAKTGLLRPGDELLEVNGVVLHGQNHMTVVQTLSQVPCEGSTFRIVVSRPSPLPLPANLYMPCDDGNYQTSSTVQERLVKAKSEQTLILSGACTEDVLKEVANRLRSRSLEPLTGLAVWSTSPTVVELIKAERGLGFSVLDYQDPLHPSETVIVVRSLVPGGIAAQDGRVVPGDRVLFVNDTDLVNANLDAAVTALKSAPKGIVRIGVAKPLPLHDEDASEKPMITQTERLLAKGSITSPRPKKKRGSKRDRPEASPPPLPSAPPPDWSAEIRRRLFPQAYYSQSSAPYYDSLPRSKTGSTLSGSFLSMGSWSGGSTPSLSPAPSPSSLHRGSWASDVVYLPPSMEKTIRIKKDGDTLGVTVEAVDKGVNGCMVKTLMRSGAFGKDKRIRVGDFLVKINNENLRCVTNSQARAILKRTNLIGTDFSVVYIPSGDAERYKEELKNHPPQDSVLQPVNRLSPNSPYFTRKGIVPLQSSDSISMDTDIECDLSGVASPSLSRSVFDQPAASTTTSAISTQPKPIGISKNILRRHLKLLLCLQLAERLESAHSLFRLGTQPKQTLVNNRDLKEATHEQAVRVIKGATNPVTFVVQSLHTFPSQGKSPSPGASGSASAASSAPGTPGPASSAIKPVPTTPTPSASPTPTTPTLTTTVQSEIITVTSSSVTTSGDLVTVTTSTSGTVHLLRHCMNEVWRAK